MTISTVSSLNEAVTEIETDFEVSILALERASGAQEAVRKKLLEARERLSEAADDAETLERVLDILSSMEGEWRRGFHKSLETLVSDGLSVVFGEPLEVHIKDSERAGASTVEFLLLKDEIETTIMGAQGGGYVVVVAFLFRVLIVLAAVPPLRRLMVLDEPFAHVSPEFRNALAEMIAELMEKLDFQIIMVTQDREYADAADMAYEFSISGGVTSVSEIKNEVE